MKTGSVSMPGGGGFDGHRGERQLGLAQLAQLFHISTP